MSPFGGPGSFKNIMGNAILIKIMKLNSQMYLLKTY